MIYLTIFSRFTEECFEYGNDEITLIDKFYSEQTNDRSPIISKDSLSREWFHTKIKLTFYIQNEKGLLSLNGGYVLLNWKNFLEKEPDFINKFNNIYKIIHIYFLARGAPRTTETFVREKKLINNLILKDLDDVHEDLLIAINGQDKVNWFNWDVLYDHYQSLEN
jgi:hypothetical protein